MPSIQPTPSNDYLISSDTKLDPPTLNAILGSVSTRLKAQEALVVDYQAAIDTLNTLGLQVIAENLGPQLVLAQDQLNELQQQAELINDYLAPLLNGVIASSSVSVATIAGLTATNVQAAIAELLTKITANETAISGLATSIASAMAQKADASALAAVKAGSAEIVTANKAVVAGGEYYVKTGAGAVVLTLPTSLVNGNILTVYRAGANVVDINNNGHPINGVADILRIDQDRTLVQLKYMDGNVIAIAGRF